MCGRCAFSLYLTENLIYRSMASMAVNNRIHQTRCRSLLTDSYLTPNDNVHHKEQFVHVVGEILKYVHLPIFYKSTLS